MHRTVCALLAAQALSAAVSYRRDVRPILASRCQPCHHQANRSGGVALDSTQGVAKAQYALLAAISGETPKMPKAGKPLSSEQVSLIRRWYEEGARDDSPSQAGTETWWSLRPITRPQVPAGDSQNPIDLFVRARLARDRLAPSPAADRRTLIRRLTYDLHGLPPTSEEIEAFSAGAMPGAYERLVDRLLASPRYGERWARHWLDVVHYGDSHGYDKDKPRWNAWPYRDYVIRAFNQDKPYARFVREQLAGDVLYPQDPEALIATGFIAAGPWDFVGHQELRENTTDKKITRTLDRDDMVTSAMSSFASMTVHCARCHDHKFDPIRQDDYYSVQAVFAGVDRADRPFDRDPETFARRRSLLAAKREIQLELQPYLDKVEYATSPEIASLDASIQDARLLLAHIGTPKTDADAAEKKQLEARLAVETVRRKSLVDAIAGADTFVQIERLTARKKEVDAALAQLPKPELVYAASAYFERAGNFRPALLPRPVYVLARGNVQAAGDEALPGAISAVTSLPARFKIDDPLDEGKRRAALAEWLVDPRNPLTWRSIVNRVWHYHFGTGLVDSPNDFGKMGGQPSHPELLDWLAAWFRDDAAGSLKSLHRLIVTSDTYRQSSAHRLEPAKLDGDNRLLWRMNRSRLDAESLRDSVLAVAGKLDLTEGGPAVRMFDFKDDHSPVYDYARFDPDAPGAYRRGVYRFTVRSVPDPFLDRMDCPDPSVFTPKRSTTLTAIQALANLNDPFIVRMSEHLAARVRNEPDPLAAAFLLALGRTPSSGERILLEPFLEKSGLENYCRLLFNSNEFLFVD